MNASRQLLARGEMLGKYEVLRLLNLGGTGELYLARTSGIEGFEKLVAVKRVLPQFAAQPEFERMLLKEARLMATLHHPNIAQVYDIGRHAGETFFAMEYVHGENLRGVLKAAASRGRGMTLGNALWISGGVAAGLHYAHEKKLADGTPLLLIHRDVSPGNIMVTHEGGIKLIDFGLAKAITRQAQTSPGSVKGNTRYMSPEQSLGGRLDRRSDVFSLGIVLFELTTGTRWIRERDDYLAVQRMLNEPLPRPSERRTKYDPELEQIVMKALARQPSDRYPTAQALQLDLEAYALEKRLQVSNIVMKKTMGELFEAAAQWGTERELHNLAAPASRFDGSKTAPMSHSPVSLQARSPLAATLTGKPLHASESVEAPPPVQTRPEIKPRAAEPVAASQRVSPVALVSLLVLLACGAALIIWAQTNDAAQADAPAQNNPPSLP